MPSRWSDKDERQYEHIKESSLERGNAEDEAEEIAARTINKQRRKRGDTRNRRTQGTGNPHQPLAERTRDELYNLAKEARIAGRSGLTKAQLVERLQASESRQ